MPAFKKDYNKTLTYKKRYIKIHNFIQMKYYIYLFHLILFFFLKI